MTRIRIGTRTSELALTQTRWVATRLQLAHPSVEVVEVPLKTTGDQDQTSALDQQGGVGLFTTELERALLTGEVDLAVHSLKDLPTKLPDGLCLAAIPEREQPWDVWISDASDPLDLEAGAVVVTGSLRRQAQILHRFPHLDVAGIRGNIDTRLAKYSQIGAGLILAAAGLRRTGRDSVIRATFGPTEMTPAPGQGALGLETRSEDTDVRAIVATLNHETSAQAVTAERAMLAHLEAGCHMPVGAIARVVSGTLSLLGLVATPDGARLLRMGTEGSATAAADVGVDLAKRLLDAGGAEILACTERGSNG